MAEIGENWVKEVLSEQEFSLMNIGTEDVFATHYDLGLIVEEKDLKYPLKITKTSAYTVCGKKKYPFKTSQIRGHLKRIIEHLRKEKRFFYLVQVCVVSNILGGRLVYVSRNYGNTVFFIKKSYFPIWLKHIKYVYLGMPSIGNVNYYMGGK